MRHAGAAIIWDRILRSKSRNPPRLTNVRFRRFPEPRNLALIGAAIATAASLGGCVSVPPGRSAIDEVTIRGASAVDPAEISDKIATASSEKFLGLFRGVVYD